MSRETSKIRHLTAEEKSELRSVIYNDTTLHRLRNTAIFEVALCCGLRASEITNMKRHAYTPTTGSLYCDRIKHSSSNTILLSKIASDALVAYLNERTTKKCESSFMFVSQKGNPISRKMLDVLMKKYCEQTSIPKDKHHFHVLKHTRAMELIKRKDVDLTEVQWLLGHKNIVSTLIYLEFTSSRQKALFEKLYSEEQDEKQNSE
jgi:site-specific recombinase XerD